MFGHVDLIDLKKMYLTCISQNINFANVLSVMTGSTAENYATTKKMNSE